MRIPESELIINGDGSVFHLHIRPEQLADRVVLVGDPGRVEMFRVLFDSIEHEGASREFVWITGTCGGKGITVLSTGIGTDNIDIVMTELDALANVDFSTREVKPVHRRLSIVRVGTCGALQPDVPLGSFIFSCYSVGFDSLMGWYAGRDAISDPGMEESLMKHMKWPAALSRPYFVKASARLEELFSDCTFPGMTISAPGFYGPQGRVVRQKLAMPDMLDDIESWRYGEWKITNFEMEGSAISGMAANLGHDAATICCAVAHRYLKDVNTDYKERVRELVELVMERMSRI